ncbi:stalk domain-containing protein [Paenibacillus glacialis]|uniref:Copper amine oxidase-like N-terminal domain-containing protein n=1 Tax=Paenibacillus glacialis TaxID=494026 RepID=A0A162LT26_9BACL|nr:stalk domain-containing protein [Paenibacillus glacialis]OAB33873.1 hypothetical protein PGLA_23430 [Paenibacillus glacialis]
MKKFIFSIIGVLIVCSIVFNGVVSAEQTKSSVLKGSGVIIKNTTLIPAAEFMKEIGGQLVINEKKEITLSYLNTNVQIQVNSKYANINNVKTFFNIPSQIIDGKLMIPLQLVKSAFQLGVSVNYGTTYLGGQYLESIVVNTDKVSVTIMINDIYERFQDLIVGRAWLWTTNVYVEDLSGNPIYDGIDNLVEVDVTAVKRNEDSDYINVYLIHKGRNLVAIIKDDGSKISFFVDSPFKRFKYSQKHWNEIKKTIVSIGMTEEMVYLSWGVYTRQTSDTYSWGTTSMWVYENDSGSDDYLFFTNGVLTNMSE